MSGWKLGLDGFVTHFMVSGPQEEPYFNEAKDKISFAMRHICVL